MSIHRTTIELVIDGHVCERDVTVHYAYMPPCRGARERSGLQLEPDYPSGVGLYSVEAVFLGDGLKPQTIDLYQLLTRECIENIESDLLVQHEESMQPDPDCQREASYEGEET